MAHAKAIIAAAVIAAALIGVAVFLGVTYGASSGSSAQAPTTAVTLPSFDATYASIQAAVGSEFDVDAPLIPPVGVTRSFSTSAIQYLTTKPGVPVAVWFGTEYGQSIFLTVQSFASATCGSVEFQLPGSTDWRASLDTIFSSGRSDISQTFYTRSLAPKSKIGVRVTCKQEASFVIVAQPSTTEQYLFAKTEGAVTRAYFSDLRSIAFAEARWTLPQTTGWARIGKKVRLETVFTVPPSSIVNGTVAVFTYQPTTPGRWYVTITVKDAGNSMRTIEFAVSVAPNATVTIGQASLFRVGVSTSSLALPIDSQFQASVSLGNAKPGDTVSIYMRIFGTRNDTSRAVAPVVSVRGLARVDSRWTVSKRIDPAWFVGFTGPFHARDVSVLDANMTLLASAARLDLADYTTWTWQDTSPNDSKFMAMHGVANATLGSNKHLRSVPTFAQTKLRFMVGDYCGSGWSSVLETKMNAIFWTYPYVPSAYAGSFQQSASLAENADFLVKFMDANACTNATGVRVCVPCSVIAHGQGGTLAAYVLAHYSGTCLHMNTNERRIVTLATAWKGTPLANSPSWGGVAFGSTCAPSFEYAPEFAKAYTDISAHVLRHIDSFVAASDSQCNVNIEIPKLSLTPDCCQFVADTILSKPNDGVATVESQQYIRFASASAPGHILGINAPSNNATLNCESATPMQCIPDTLGYKSYAFVGCDAYNHNCLFSKANSYQCHSYGMAFAGVLSDLARMAWIHANL